MLFRSINQAVSTVTIRQPKLRWQIPPALPETLRHLVVRECRRRAKYLLIRFDTGVLLIHLGMSGSLRIWQSNAPAAGKHDHVDIAFANSTLLRYHDPRRFGAILWLAASRSLHATACVP